MKKEELSSPRLKILIESLRKIQRSGEYLEEERARLMRDKDKVASKIRKEKEILRLRDRIKRIKKKK
ncbi:MAG: hypothetical protein Q8P81_02410 [Nanoarchaeota archaeon]|nr:hypothetical protein [Nanoarchaeota archaeon]